MKTDDLFLSRLAEVRRPLQAWRGTRQGRGRIPETFWSSIVPLAKTYGLSQVARALGLDYYGLKRRVLAARSSRAHELKVKDPAFVELKLGPRAVEPQCVVELENPAGARMILRLAQSSNADLLRLAEAFWRQSP